MSLVALLILGLAVVPAFGLAVLGWLALDEDADDMRGFVLFEAAHAEN